MSATLTLLSVMMLTPSPVFVSSFAYSFSPNHPLKLKLNLKFARRNINTNINQGFSSRRGNHDCHNQLHQTQTTIDEPTSASTSSPSTNANANQSQQLPQPPLKMTPSPYAAQTLDGRLLCSSQCAYEIKAPYFRGSSYRPNTTARRITRGANSVLVGHTSDGITVAFRGKGTQTTSLLDWLQNAALYLSDVDEKKYKIQGKIHKGFYRGTTSLWKPLKGILKEMLVEAEEHGWSQEIYLTGHSKGGALASLASIFVKRDKSLPDPTYVW